MSKVAIITDSIHGLPPELIQKHDIKIAPMGVVVNNKGYRDMIDIFPAQFYPLFKKATLPSSTNAAAPGDFLEHYTALSRTTDSIVYIGVSSVLTATFKSAEQAREIFLAGHPRVKIELIDSKNCEGALGFVVLEAARAAEAGQGLSAVVNLVQGMLPRIKYLSVLDTLRYLLKIGRIPKSAASEEKLKFRPMIGMTDNSGLMQNFPAVEVDRALEKLVDLAGKYMQPGKPVHAIIHHSEYVDEAEQLREMVILRFHPVELYIAEYSPAALSSTGLMSGLAFYT